ncbi:MAG TPA: hypothetical protein VFN57_05165 [Thermomicrobiaceae bacterium]|nr:hypothetical protein [Thermomicrobiaceae bacterium]
MLQLHQSVAAAIALYMLILGIWGLVAAARSGVTPSYRGSLAVAEVLTLVEAAIGGLLLVAGDRPGDPLHFLYGALVPLGIPATYIFAHTRSPRRAALLYGIATLFIVGLTIRAIMTGRPS